MVRHGELAGVSGGGVGRPCAPVLHPLTDLCGAPGGVQVTKAVVSKEWEAGWGVIRQATLSNMDR